MKIKKTQKFGENYFKTNLYKDSNFDKKYTMYWWSCRFYSKLVLKFFQQGKLLEIGCGLGHLLGRLSENFDTTGIDVNKWAIDECKKRFPESKFYVLPAEDVEKLKEKYEVVVIRHVLEHLASPEDVIKKVSNLVKPKGLLLIATPNPDGIMAKIQKENWVNLKDPTHISINRPEKWIEVLKKYGFKLRLSTSDGFWAAPYLPFIPTVIQKFSFGLLGGFQAITGIVFLPPNWGENLILVMQKIDYE